MAFVYCMGECYGCKRLFSFHPNHVPSIPINGQREPICEACVARANPRRIAAGLEPIRPHPLAYEPADERDIDWGG